MKSVVELELNAPQSRVAALFDDIEAFPEWMSDLERVEPIGSASSDGTRFRLVPKKGTLVFVARVVHRDPARWSRLALDAQRVSVRVTGSFIKMSDEKTKLVSEEIFTFKGFLGGIWGVIGRPAITRAHRRHMQAFKRFAERH